MTVTSGFFPSVEGDRKYTAEQFGAMFNGVISDGIFSSVGDGFAVSADGTMVITVGSGRGWFNLSWIKNDADITVTVDTADPTNDRIDTLVIKVDKTAGVRASSIEIVKGTPAATPVAPTLTDTASVFYKPLADIYVTAASSVIDSGDLTNRIGIDTPFVAGLFETVDISWLFAAWSDDLDAWFANLQNQLDANQATNLQNQIDDILAGDGLDSAYRLSHNLVKNSPSRELADGATPMWWSTSNGTLTEEDATGEGVPATKNERIFKLVTSAASGYAYQEFVPANERLLRASVTKVSAGVWVYFTTAGTVTFRLKDSVSGVLASDATSLTSGWNWLEVRNVTIGANTLRWELEYSVNAATVYFANPMLNTGPRVNSYRPRGFVFKQKNVILANSVDPNGGSITIDVTSQASPNTAMVQIQGLYVNQTSDQAILKVGRLNGPSQNFITGIQSKGLRSETAFLCDDQQRISISSTAAAGDTESVYITLTGYWEWE